MADGSMDDLGRTGDDPLGLTGRTVVVAGAGTAGLSAARYLLTRDVRLVLADDRFAAADADADARRAAVDAVAGGLVEQGARAVSVGDLLADDGWASDTAAPSSSRPGSHRPSSSAPRKRESRSGARSSWRGESTRPGCSANPAPGWW